VLTPKQARNYEDISLETLQPYWNERLGRYDFPDDLFFVSREDDINLDFYPTADGFLASNALVDTLEKFGSGRFVFRSVAMTNEAGVPNSSKPMNFCQITEQDNACDYSEMDIDGSYHGEIDGPNKLDRSGKFPVVSASISIKLKEGLPELFSTKQIPKFTWVASERIKKDAEGKRLIGPFFISLNDIAVVDFAFDGPGGFSKTEPRWIEKSDFRRWGEKVDRKTMFDPSSDDAKAMLEKLLKG
jgi:hypothetical protein